MVKFLSVRFLLCLAATSVFEIQAYEIWHPIDIQSVICPSPASGNTSISVDFDDLGHNNLTFPHIFSFFRTFNKSVKIYYKAVDAKGKQIVGGTHTVGGTNANALGLAALVAVPGSSRRLGSQQVPAAAEELKEKDLLEAEEDELEPTEPEEEDVSDEEEATEDKLGERRLLSGRSGHSNEERRMKGAKGGSSKSKSKSSSSKTKAKAVAKPPTYSKTPPSTGTSPSSYTNARRRANPVTARRRSTPVPTGARRRATSPVDGKTYSNPSNAQAGSYGYSTPAKINSNYPAGYSSSSYGYSGANAHKSSSTKNIMMGAAVGGMAGMYVGSRWGHNGWGWRNRQCYNSYSGCGSSYSGSCSGCYRQYDNNPSCRRQCGNRVNRNVARDDIMGTGFMPVDFVSPATFTIYKIEGVDFTDLSGLCPPVGWDPNASQRLVSWTPKDPQPDLWVTVTALMELEEQLGLDVTHYDVSSAFMHGPSFILAALVAFGLHHVW